MKNYNTTQLNPDTAFEKHVFHRDMFAHYLRWSHVLRLADQHSKILDVGCGNGNLYEVFYRNLKQPARYLGLDIRKQTIKKNKVKFPKAEFETQDLVKQYEFKDDWDFICSFEVAEHVGKSNVPAFLENIKRHCNDKTVVLISTQNFDPTVGAADNHTYDTGDGNGIIPQELTFNEMKNLVEKDFKIENVYGTFASIKDYKKLLSSSQQEMFEKLTEYYDPNLVSVIFAPLFPEQARNCIWKLKLK